MLCILRSARCVASRGVGCCRATSGGVGRRRTAARAPSRLNGSYSRMLYLQFSFGCQQKCGAPSCLITQIRRARICFQTLVCCLFKYFTTSSQQLCVGNVLIVCLSFRHILCELGETKVCTECRDIGPNLPAYAINCT